MRNPLKYNTMNVKAPSKISGLNNKLNESADRRNGMNRAIISAGKYSYLHTFR